MQRLVKPLLKRPVTIVKKRVVGGICIISLSGYATFKTLDSELPLNQRMFVYSGTRLDWSAITK
jgi:hypothetical protein